jgi:large subunit ribosomal protein L10
MEGLTLDEDKFKSIARLPAREVLNGQLAGVVASPLTGLVRGLGSMIQGLALQLGQIAEKGLVGGEATAEEAPATEAPEESPAEEPAAEEKADEPAAEEAEAEPTAEAEDDETSEADEETSETDDASKEEE